ncbi:HPr family phosphocarrier protein [Clostridium sp. ZS2-4]|uniref:HPr family phosphocarrier protein n=1 Tax=Clostridium sp. ZS2-4 TaxID=2987703 RepID=UPI00227D1680|nr:HPr family phosphocarrier protein [Clostridium sp. ZS2-4]MCY6354654.1 HPr family phosphocarrier protein [Clostridium sp. ZS2-4]
MVQSSVKVNNKTGIHAIPATIIAKEARKYEADISIFKNTDYCNAVSPTAILSMDLIYGDELLVVVEGDDELHTIKEIKSLIESDFGV